MQHPVQISVDVCTHTWVDPALGYGTALHPAHVMRHPTFCHLPCQLLTTALWSLRGKSLEQLILDLETVSVPWSSPTPHSAPGRY